MIERRLIVQSKKEEIKEGYSLIDYYLVSEFPSMLYLVNQSYHLFC
jgi:hypothetical protein